MPAGGFRRVDGESRRPVVVCRQHPYPPATGDAAMGPLVPTGTDIDRETLLDITVNLIPIGILAFFVVTFLVYTPFPPNLFAFLISHFLTIFPLVLLALLTYVAAKVIARDERKLEERSNAGGGLEARSTAGEAKAPATGEEEPADETTEESPAETGDGREERRSERDIDSEEEDELGVRHEDERADERERPQSADAPESGGADTEETTDERH